MMISNAITSGHRCAASSRQNLPPVLNPPRRHSEAIRDLDYVTRLNQRHRRLYGRLHHSLRFLELIAASFGLAAAISATANTIAVAGGVLAVVAFAGLACEPAKQHHLYDLTLQRYSALRAKAANMTLEAIDQQYACISDPDYIEALRLPSFNDMMRSHGLYRAIRPLSRWQRLCAALA